MLYIYNSNLFGSSIALILVFHYFYLYRGPRGARGYRGMARGIIRGSAYFGYRPTRRPR